MQARQVIFGLMALPSVFAVATAVVHTAPHPVTAEPTQYCNAAYNASDQTAAPMNPDAPPYLGYPPHPVHMEWMVNVGVPTEQQTVQTPVGSPVNEIFREKQHNDPETQLVVCGYLLKTGGPTSDGLACLGELNSSTGETFPVVQASYGLEFREARTGRLITRFTAEGSEYNNDICADMLSEGAISHPVPLPIDPGESAVQKQVAAIVGANAR